eukprot:scaffold4825_cov132-Cylindrotheca_fusiformis.AAC.11
MSEEEEVALTTSDLLARIQALEADDVSCPDDPTVDDLEEKLSVLEARIERTQAKKIQSLEANMVDTRKKLNRSKSLRYVDVEDDDSVEEQRAFPDNTFSFLLIAKYPLCESKKEEDEIDLDSSDHQTGKNSPDYLFLPFLLALAVLVMQLAIYSLALQNATDFKDTRNPFQFPINVDPFTRAVELLTVIITVYTQNNIFHGVDLFVQSFKYIQEMPGVSAWKYYAAATTQTIVGIYGIFVTFIIIMQSTEVVDLLLDFTAMEFVAALDDAAFALSLGGFLGRAMKKTARTVKTARYTPHDKRKWLRKWPMVVVSILLIICYVLVRIGQDNRIFGENELDVQLHDNAIPWLSTLSGTYFGCTISGSDSNKLDVGPIIYTKHPVEGCDKNWKKEQGAFFYCGDEHWVFAVEEEMSTPCKTWSMKSYKADSSNADAYDILSHASATWFAKDLNGLVEDGVVENIGIYDSFILAESAETDCNVLESRGLAFHFPLYSRLGEVLFGSRPVFYAGDSLSGEYVLFNGRRWIVVEESSIQLDCLQGCNLQATPLSCRADCLMLLDLFASNYTVRLISDPMDLRTSSDTWIPTEELIWYLAKGSGSSSAPDVDKVSVAQAIKDVPQLLDAVTAKQATAEQLIEAEGLFVQSSSLGCSCNRNDDECERKTACANGSSLLIDLVTDGKGNETKFFILDVDSYAAFADGAANAVDLVEWLEEGIGLEGVQYLNDTGFFSWQNVQSINYDILSNYRYKTCMPENSCAVLSFEDLAGDGISFPGGFNVFYDGQRLSIDNYTFIAHCLYQFGPACETTVKCSSTTFFPSYNPDIECLGGTPLAFEGLKENSYSTISYFLTDIDSWTADLGADAVILNGTGQFAWQKSVANGYSEELSSRYSTCVPDDVCAVMDVSFNVIDSSFSLIYNGTPIEPEESELNTLELGNTFCVYQLGSSCEEPGVVCSKQPILPPFNPEVECPRGSPLAFRLFTDSFPADNSLLLMDNDSWERDGDQSAQVLNATGFFPFQNVQMDSFAAQSSHLYSTCVPDDMCVVLVLSDFYGDGFAGGITVAYNRSEISSSNVSSMFSTSCQFYFGACERDDFCV